MKRPLVQLELFHAEPMPHELLHAEERALQRKYDDLAEAFDLPPARVVLSTRRSTGSLCLPPT